MLVIQHHPHRALADLVVILALSRHDSILLKDQSLHRTRGGSLATGVMIAIPLDMIVTDTIESARPWLPGQLFQAVAGGGTQHLEYWSSFVTVLAGGVAALAVALAVFHRRDVTS